MFPACQWGMTPIVASGAASLAGVLINKAASYASSASGNVSLDSKQFERALNKAAGSRERSAVEHQAADLRQRLMNRPELEAAIYSQPAGSVSGVQIHADGSVSLQTAKGPVAVQLGDASRELAQSLYAVSAVQGVVGAPSLESATQPPLTLPLQGGTLR
jgi:hypothetical protein